MKYCRTRFIHSLFTFFLNLSKQIDSETDGRTDYGGFVHFEIEQRFDCFYTSSTTIVCTVAATLIPTALERANESAVLEFMNASLDLSLKIVAQLSISNSSS